MSRTFSAITDLGQPDVWVMDPKVQFIDDVKPLQDTQLYRVRGVEGVEWAVPLYKGLLKARLSNGNFQTCNLFGLDDATLIGGPPEMVEGRLERPAPRRRRHRRRGRGHGSSARPQRAPADHRCRSRSARRSSSTTTAPSWWGSAGARTFQSQPVVYTTYSRATTFAPRERKLLSFVLVGQAGRRPEELCRRIQRVTGLAALTREDFKWKTVMYFLKYTGIPINFGIAVLLGFLVGTAIAGQTFYNFTLDNLRAVRRAQGDGGRATGRFCA